MSTTGAFGSNAVGPRTDKPEYKEFNKDGGYNKDREYKDREYKDNFKDRDARPAQTEEKKEVSKPMFTSSKKKTLEGGASVEEI